MIRLAKESRIRLMIVKNITRFSRDIGKQAWLEHQLKEAGVEIFYYDEQYDDTPTGRFARDMIARAGQWQLEIGRELSMQARLDKVTDFRRPVGNGQTPYGWRRVRDERGAKKTNDRLRARRRPRSPCIRRFRDLLHRVDAELLRHAERRGHPLARASGSPYREATALRASGGISSMHHVLKNPMTSGEYRYRVTEPVKVNGKVRHVAKRGAEPVTLQLEPILTRAEVAEIRTALSSRSNRNGRDRIDDDCRTSCVGCSPVGCADRVVNTQ